jgi:hypothetical protein
VSLVLLTISVALGVAEVVRYARPGWPRFVLAALHKNASLLAVAFLAVHIITAIADSFAPIHLIDAFVPFVGSYRPFWLGLGALALDLLIALVVTSLLRERIGYRAWRVVHWSAYACWPVALLHGLGTGSDTRVRWGLVVNVACIAVVLVAIWWRIGATRTAPIMRRATATIASVAIAFGVVAWMLLEPMRPGWARKAGTPTALLAAGGSTTSADTQQLSIPFASALRGSIAQTGPDASGNSTVRFDSILPAAGNARLQVAITGASLDDGGVRMDSSTVQLGPASAPDLYQGRVESLNGTDIVARLHDANGARITVTMQLTVDPQSNAVGGTATARRKVAQ